MSIATLLIAPPAAAQAPRAERTAAQRETARALMQNGDRHFAAGDHRAAAAAYAAADRIMDVPTTALALARARERLGLLVEAADALARARRHPETPGEPRALREARDEAKRLDAELAKRIPRLVPQVEGPSSDTPLTLSVDGSAVVAEAARAPQRVNPGEHVLRMEAAGFLPAEATVRVEEGEQRQVKLVLRADPKARSESSGGPKPTAREQAGETPATKGPTLSTLSIAALSAGVTNLALGLAFGVVALQRSDALEARCGGTVCPEAERGAQRDIDRMATVSNAAWALTAIGLGTAAVSIGLDLTSDDGQVAVGLGPGSGRIQVRF
jgi:hypothetical protein